MDPHDPLPDYLRQLRVTRLGTERSAGLFITSLPLPRQAPTSLSLAGRSTYCQPLGQWYDASAGSPRRLLLVADGGEAPETLAITEGHVAPSTSPPTAEMQFIARNPEEIVFWEKHALKICWGGHTVELMMGLRTGGEVHWWEACRLVTLEDTDTCRTVEMGGAIPVEEYSLSKYADGFGYKDPHLHKHNWLNGHILARLHANGVCEVFAHHINSKFFDDGLSFDDVVPVIGIRTEQGCQGVAALTGDWDGTQTEITLGNVRFDMAEVARLATAEKPGNVCEEQGFVVLQPYLGVEIYGGVCPEALTGDAYAIHAEEKRFPRGLARTLRFSFSLSPDRAPNVVRYLAPAWWYGACEEFMPEPLLPVSNDYDIAPQRSIQWIMKTIQRRGFEDGCAARCEIKKEGDFPRPEPGWEGEIPYAQLLSAWRSGDQEEYEFALRSVYFINDIVMDHASKTGRMHGYAPPYAFSVPMTRVLGSIAAYLETGDKYLLDTARACTEHTYWIHKNSWPRNAVGRDACPIRGAVMLYRFFGEQHYLTIARDAIQDVINSQRPDGTFGDQAGGSGIHQWGAYITKPWMGCMALGGALDYLELIPHDEDVAQCVKRFADWLMSERAIRDDGVMGWTYQHNYAGSTRFLNYKTGAIEELLPTKMHWHKDYFARIMLFCSLRYGQPGYFDAWEESFRGKKAWENDHAAAQGIQFVPWLQAKLWNARLTKDGVVADPVRPGERTPADATILTPDGPAYVRWLDEARVQAPEQIKIAEPMTK